MNERPMTLPEIHKGTVEILKKIISICDELNINYFMAYGSLIGVVRHQGFIPWDDDLDIMMLRPEYEKFKAYCREHEEELFPYRLMGRDNTPDYPFTINRFCDLRYKMVTENTPDSGMGMFIDIYPMDGAGNDPEETKKQLKRKWFWINCVFSAQDKKFRASSKGLLRTIAKYPAHLYARIMGAQYFMDKLERLKDSYSLETSCYIACMIWDWPIILKEKIHFEEYVYMDFEGIQVKVPKEYDAVLRSSYGDYMKLPPENQRVPHHEYKLYRRSEYFNDLQQKKEQT